MVRELFQSAQGGLVGVLLLLVMVAGCTSGPEAPPAEATPTASASFGNSDKSAAGKIVGLVVTDDLVPLAKVQVSVLELELEVTTGTEGAFEFLDVPVGTYRVVASRLGYESGARAVNVDADNQTVEVEFELAPIVVEESYQTTETFEGYLTCGLALVPWCGIFDELNQDYGTPNPTEERWLFTWTFPTAKAPANSLFEVVWTPTVGGTSNELSLLGLSGFDDSATGSSPVRLWVDGKDWANDLEDDPEFTFRFGIYPELVDPVVYQRFTVFRTDFYGEEGPEDYTYVPE